MIIPGPSDAALLAQVALPNAGAAANSPVFDFQAIAPNSDAWRQGRIALLVPAIPLHTDATKTITVEIQTAAAALANNSVAPALPVPGAFANANPRQIAGVAGVANTGSAATVLYFDIPLDANGSAYQFCQFVVTVPAGDANANEVLTLQWTYM